jgi:hypothetical protein
MIDADKLRQLVARFPVPAAKDSKLAEVDKTATDAALAELIAGGKDAVTGLVGLLEPAEKGSDLQARHALHALVLRAGALKPEQRQGIAEALAATLSRDHPAGVKVFVLQQLQLVGGPEVTPTLGKLATTETIGEEAVRTLVAIRTGAAEPLRAALPEAKGRNRLVIAQALGTLKDSASVPELRKLLAGDDSEIRQVAGWGLANIGAGEAAEDLLRQADAAKGFERTKLTDACLLLAENLLAADKKKEATGIYSHLQRTRTDAVEKHIRDAATRGLTAVK